MSNWIIWLIVGVGVTVLVAVGIWLWIWLSGNNDCTKLDHFATTPKEMIGYGLVNQWPHLSKSEAAEMAERMAAKKNTVTQVELLSNTTWDYYDTPDIAIDKFAVFAHEFLKRRITILVTIINWNARHVCESRFGPDWFAYVVNRLKAKVGTEGIIIEACSEWGPKGRNAVCWRKAEGFCNWTAANWLGMKAWNKTSRPNSAPANHYIDHHPLSTKALGPATAILVTDTSPILNELGGLHNYFNPEKVKAYAQKVKNTNRGLILYDYHNPSGQPDYNAIKALGEIV